MEDRSQFRENQYFGNTPTALPNSTAVLVLGISSIVLCFCSGLIGTVCSIVSLILYSKDKKLYAATPQAFTPSSYNT